MNAGKNYAGEMDYHKHTDLQYCFYRCIVLLQCRSVNCNHETSECVLGSTEFDEDESLGPDVTNRTKLAG